MQHLNSGRIVPTMAGMNAILIAAVLAGGCGASRLSVANGTALAVSTASLALDWRITHNAAASGWYYGPTGIHDSNSIMGTNPSPGIVNTYFVSAALINGMIWLVMPRRYRALVPIAVTAVQTNAIAGNIERYGAPTAFGF